MMKTEPLSTREKILRAATELIAANGYANTTTKQISLTAGVSEMTLFRHFRSKKAILLTILQAHLFDYPLENDIIPNLTWDLDHDLLMIAQMQYRTNSEHAKTSLIKFKEINTIMELIDDVDIKESPKKLKAFLIEYFTAMAKRRHIIDAAPEDLANYFMSFNFGIFCDTLLTGEYLTAPEGKAAEIQFGVKLFTRGITK